MTLREQIQADMITATKASAVAKRDCLRLAISTLKYKEVETKKPLTDAEVVSALQTMIKQRRESIDQFHKGNRVDLADKEIEEVAILEAYLPKQMDDAALAAIIAAAITETGAAGMKDMGKVMKAVQAKTAGAAEGSRVSALVKEKLGKV